MRSWWTRLSGSRGSWGGTSLRWMRRGGFPGSPRVFRPQTNMPKNHAKAKLRAGECVYGTSVEYCLDPEISLLLKKAGLDLFFIDTEHQAASYADIRAICRTARDFEIAPLVRVTQGEPALITRALDCGAMGIVVP